MDALLLALPFVLAVGILVVSAVRRRRHSRTSGTTEPVHRGQSDSAAVQSAAVSPPLAARKAQPGRERRGKGAA